MEPLEPAGHTGETEKPLDDSPAVEDRTIAPNVRELAGGQQVPAGIDWNIRNLAIVAAVVLGVLFLAFGWPTAYRYDTYGAYHALIRTNRFTGESESLTPQGWQRMEKPSPNPFDEALRDYKPSAPAVQPNPYDELL